MLDMKIIRFLCFNLLILFPFLAHGMSLNMEIKAFPFHTTLPLFMGNPDSIPCEPVWRYGITGEFIGESSLTACDIDHNGTMDLVFSAQYDYMGYWYIMHYNNGSATYTMDWVSNGYDNFITRLAVLDTDQDSIAEIFAGFDNGEIFIFKGDSKELINVIPAQTTSSILEIQLGDADNDGINELVVSDIDSIYMYSISAFSLKSTIPFGGESFRIGNVDADTLNELVTTKGKVLEISGTGVLEQWSFDNTSSGLGYLLGLEDLDSDGMKEIIRAKKYNQFTVWDADTETPKFTYTVDYIISALNFYDINNDGIKEIVYGDDQWGSIHFISPLTHLEVWNIPNPEHDITDICIGDFDGDNADEIGWGSNQNSSAGDLFIVKDIHTKALEYVSPCLDGPFYALETGDVDNDGTQEIVAISYESEGGYGSGIITVFDAVTHLPEWQCNGEFLYQVWDGSYNLEINDIDNDGVPEIIVAADQLYKGKIWVIDGITKTIESSHLFSSEDLSSFTALAVDDVDDDGNKEYVACTQDEVVIIDPVNYSIKWKTQPILANWTPKSIKIGNIDNDPAKEIVVCNNRLNVIDAVSHTTWPNIFSGYSSMDLHDTDGDSLQEIVLGTTSIFPGELVILDGITHLADTVISLSPDPIDALLYADLNGDSIPEFIYTAGGRMYIMSDTVINAVTQKFGGELGTADGLKVGDINNDGKPEIVMGTTIHLLEFTNAAYDELFLSSVITGHPVSCHGNVDGTASVQVTHGKPPYTYIWSNGSVDSLNTGLGAGVYSVTITDARGQKLVQSVTLTEPDELLLQTTSTPDNGLTPAFEGTATVVIQGGTPPYTILWGDSAAQTGATAIGLMPGTYFVWVTDSNACMAVDTIVVDVVNGITRLSSPANISLYPNPSEGVVYYTVNQQQTNKLNIMVTDPLGSVVYQKETNTGSGGLDLSSLEPGIYLVKFYADSSCKTIKVQLIK